jgi:hypothetical protein
MVRHCFGGITSKWCSPMAMRSHGLNSKLHSRITTFLRGWWRGS